MSERERLHDLPPIITRRTIAVDMLGTTMRAYGERHKLVSSKSQRRPLLSAYECRQQLFSTDYVRLLLDLKCVISNVQEVTIYEFVRYVYHSSSSNIQVIEFRCAPVYRPFVMHMLSERHKALQSGNNVCAKTKKLTVNAGIGYVFSH